MRRAGLLSLLVAVAACAGGTAPPSTTPDGPRPSASPLATPSAPSAPPPAAADAGPSASSKPPTADPPAAAAEDAKADARASNEATLRLFAKARKAMHGNLMLSGTSLRQALVVPYLGARGDTAKEMAAALGYRPDATKAAALAHAETTAWEEARGKGGELSVANRMWTEKTFSLRPEFVKAATSAVDASVEPVDFKGAAEASRKAINAWVADKTADKIVDLLPAGTVDARTRVVVTNAVWFRGRWTFPFPEGATKDEPFHLDAKKTVQAPLMHMTESMGFAETPTAKLVELSYLDTDLTFLVLVPKDVAGLAKIEDLLAPDAIDLLAKDLAPRQVALTLPKFTFRSGGDLRPVLRDLGMRAAFTDRADFTGATDARPFDVSDVVQRTYVAVDEKGTEAAAATGVVMRATSAFVGKPEEVRADRPFLFFIRDAKRGRVLFVGHLVNPKP